MAENIYTKGTRVWFEDKDHAWISAEVFLVSKGTDDTIKLVFVDERGKEITLITTGKEIKEGKEGLPPLRNPPLLETADDLATLSHLNEPSVLHTIRNRYGQHSIYTYSGIVLIAVNPFQRVTLYGPEIIQAYSGRKRGELEPHLFAIAEDAYTAMRKEGMGQTIIVSGESGAGKTESAKFIMRYLASVNPPDTSKPKTKISLDDSSEIERQILATNPILEAFGNAKTTRNDNSSRFGKYIQILFDGKQEIVGARIRTYLLERSRIVFQPLTERNYHIFYQLCAGAPLKERKDLGLDADITKFYYLKQGGPSSTPIAGIDDAEEFRATQQALSTVGISVEKQWAVFRLLAALLHLGNIKITQLRSDAAMDDSDPALMLATRFLGVSLSEFKKWTVKKQIQTRSEKIVTSLNAAQATVVRDSVAKFVYACMFEWLVAIVNESLAGENGDAAERAEMFIGVLDIYGFEHFQKNSFEQFSINYANEKLQQEFNSHVFKLEQEEYVKEEIKWKFIDFSDNQPCIDVIEGKLGVLALLDEESRMPAGTDASFLQKLNTQILGKNDYKPVFKKPRFGNSAFTIAHYALDVTYEVEGFLEKNRDTVPDEQMGLLAATKNPFLKEVLDAALNSTKVVDGPQPASPAFSDSGSGGSRRSSLIPDPGRQSFVAQTTHTGSLAKRPGAANKKPTQGSIFKASLIALMDTLSTTNVHYIRCIKPNELKRPWEFQPQQVLGQLRACGVLETIRISCAGYPTRWTYEEFAERYYMLVPSSDWQPMIQSMDLRRLCSTILDKTIADPDMYQNGLTKIFFRAGMLAALESFRSDRLNAMVTVVQKNVRRILAVKRYRNLRRATIRLQTWWRGILARRFVEGIRREVSAMRLQTAVRRFLQRKQFLNVRCGIILFQSRVRGIQTRNRYIQERSNRAATLLQSLLRGVLSRRGFKSDVSNVIYIQSCIRRRIARKELKVLKAEARSVSKFKEISYRLENKVIELTQSLQERTAEKKKLQSQLAELEQQLQQWINRHEEADNRAKQLQSNIQMIEIELVQRSELLSAKADVEKRLEETMGKALEKEASIQKLTDEIIRQAAQLESQQRTIETAPPRNQEDNSVIMTLKNEVSSLREQLNRSNALNALTRGARNDPPLSPTFAPGLRIGEANGLANVATSSGQHRGHQRRHSSSGVFHAASNDRSPSDDILNDVKRSHFMNPRAVSVAFNGEDNYLRLRTNGLPDIRDFDDPAEEKIRLMQDVKRLDEDVLDGLIRGLKIPAPSITNPSAMKEILFPANLISLVTNEMWKYGLIQESERFLANVMQTIQTHVMSFTGEDAIIPGIYWLSNVHEMLSFICVAESDMLQGIGPGEENAVRSFDWNDYERLVSVVKHDLDSLEYNIYHTWMLETKKRLSKMVIPALIESQSLPGFTTSDGGGRLFNRLLNSNSQPAFSMDDILNLLNRVWKSLKSYYMEESVVQQVITELLKLIGVASFNDLLMRRNFSSWKRAMQIQYNITRIEEWCKSHGMPEGTLQLEHLMQVTKLLQLKKATPADIENIYDVCWMLSPMQIQRMCTNYYVADYENPISPEILRVVASRVQANDRNDHLLLAPENEEVGPYELPLPREVSGLETYVPAYLNVSHLRRLAALVS